MALRDRSGPFGLHQGEETEVLDLEQRADLPPGGVRDDQGARQGQRLQAGRSSSIRCSPGRMRSTSLPLSTASRVHISRGWKMIIPTFG